MAAESVTELPTYDEAVKVLTSPVPNDSENENETPPPSYQDAVKSMCSDALQLQLCYPSSVL